MYVVYTRWVVSVRVWRVCRIDGRFHRIYIAMKRCNEKKKIYFESATIMITDARNTEISLHKCRINRLENIVLYVTRAECTTLVDFMASRFFAIKSTSGHNIEELTSTYARMSWYSFFFLIFITHSLHTMKNVIILSHRCAAYDRLCR